MRLSSEPTPELEKSLSYFCLPKTLPKILFGLLLFRTPPFRHYTNIGLQFSAQLLIFPHRDTRNENADCGGKKNDFTIVQCPSDNRCYFYQNKVLCILRPSKETYRPNGEREILPFANLIPGFSLLPCSSKKNFTPAALANIFSTTQQPNVGVSCPPTLRTQLNFTRT